MCIWKIDNDWRELKKKLKQDDILALSSLQDLYQDSVSIQEKLTYCSDIGVQINLKGVCLYDDIYMDILDAIMKEDEVRREKMKMAQERGIKRALKKYKEGNGRYGRPRTQVPDDFEEQVRYHKKNKLSLERYWVTTNMKKSTFYKYARLVDAED